VSMRLLFSWTPFFHLHSSVSFLFVIEIIVFDDDKVFEYYKILVNKYYLEITITQISFKIHR
jgi:hypothetical protein